MTRLDTDLSVQHHGRPLGSAPTLLFLHGLTDSGSGWPEAVRHWAERYAIVAYDARGHGHSPRFTREQLEGQAGDVMVDDAVGLLEQLDRPVVIGHSLGGAVALTAGVRRPELVRGLVLEDPAPLGPEEPARSPRAEQYVDELEPSRSAPDEEALYRLRKEQHPAWPDSELLVTGLAEQQMDVDYLATGRWKPSGRWPDLLASVTVPTLIVSGDRADELCVDDAMERGIADIANPSVTLVRLSGAGHCVRRDQPAAYYAAVDEWLAAL